MIQVRGRHKLVFLFHVKNQCLSMDKATFLCPISHKTMPGCKEGSSGMSLLYIFSLPKISFVKFANSERTSDHFLIFMAAHLALRTDFRNLA